MANILNKDKQIAIIAALAEGPSIRSIERITGVHRDTIMRLGVKIGQGCTAMMDETPTKPMRGCTTLGKRSYPVTVLHIHPALTSATAVRAFIVQEFRNAATEA